MELFRKSRIINYQKKEIERLERNLKKLANGESDIDLEVSEGDNCVGAERDQFIKMNQYLSKIKESFSSLVKDTENLSSNIKDGNLNYRMDTTRYNGLYSRIGKDINASFETISEPLNKTIHILETMALNDYTLSMDTNYKGDFATMANAINLVKERLLAVENVAVKISQGDISELENYRNIGKRSDNDRLVPALTNMMEAVQALIDATATFVGDAENGNLDARGDAGKFKGEYGNIIRGFNGTLDAVVKPIKEVIEVMSQISVGNLGVTVKGNYKGEFATLANVVNSTAEILNHVVEEIGDILSEIAQGNFNILKVREFKGDFGTISDSLNKIINSLNEIFREINTASEQVAAGAGQISETSLTLSQGSEEQASSIEEVTASITEMAAQVKQNAANATQADKLSLTAKVDAVKGNEQMKEMVQAMHDINESSTNISRIIKVIDDIAFQTNILALNAAVEAARAGQYGKGFAVVAEEVKNLAQQSASAAKETTTMIEGSIEKVGTGTKIANNTEQALNEIVESITKAAELVGQIASASNEQATAISQVNQAVEQVSQVIQTNSATAEESASASEELSSQAEMLKQTVNNVKLKDAKDMKLASLDKLSPDIIRAIEEMIEKKNKVQGNKVQENKSQDKNANVSEKKAAVSGGKPQISLDDGEFGKY
ncbi:MAG: methyl-accepting chemotaxis protein [Desulfitobacteriaceae bacterium]|nr:methyl-accepting chemotaxis protein [Desulfitobacteriaceae bacterium]